MPLLENAAVFTQNIYSVIKEEVETSSQSMPRIARDSMQLL